MPGTWITEEQVQQWLETTKLGVTEVDPELESTAATYCIARVAEIADTSTWVDGDSTPDLLNKLISMLVAAWTYERTYSEATSDNPTWAQRLERLVERILDGISSGSIVLVDEDPLRDTGPSFLPDDSTGYTDVYDALGNLASLGGSEDIKFSMGTKF